MAYFDSKLLIYMLEVIYECLLKAERSVFCNKKDPIEKRDNLDYSEKSLKE